MKINYSAIALHQQKKMTQLIESLAQNITSADELKQKIDERFAIVFRKLTLTVTVEEVTKNENDVDFIVSVSGKPIK